MSINYTFWNDSTDKLSKAGKGKKQMIYNLKYLPIKVKINTKV